PLLLNLCNRAPLSYKNNILVLHDITFIRYPQSFSFCFRMLYNFLLLRLVRSAKKLLTISEFSRKEISEYYHLDSTNIDIIYNAVSNSFQQLDIMDKDNYILAVSSDVYNKNFERLILAFIQMNQKSNLKLKIVGRTGSIVEKYLKMGFNNLDIVGRVSD